MGASVGAGDTVGAVVGMCVQSSSVAMLTSWTWAVVDLYAYGAPCKGTTIRTDGSNAVCIVDLSLDDPESDAATGSVPRALLVLVLPGLLALGLL